MVERFKSFVDRKIRFLILCCLVDVLVTCALLGYFMIANQLVDLFFVSCSLIAV
jgi:hypothetical protein